MWLYQWRNEYTHSSESGITEHASQCPCSLFADIVWQDLLQLRNSFQTTITTLSTFWPSIAAAQFRMLANVLQLFAVRQNLLRDLVIISPLKKSCMAERNIWQNTFDYFSFFSLCSFALFFFTYTSNSTPCEKSLEFRHAVMVRWLFLFNLYNLQNLFLRILVCAARIKPWLIDWLIDWLWTW